MANQIEFFRKNHLDLNRDNPSITITDNVASSNGQSSVNQLRNRNNITGWLTTGSDDTANTEILAEFGDLLSVDFVELVRHNFKDFLIEWKDVSDTWNTYENVTSNTELTTIHRKDTAVETRALRITIYSTQTADADKELRQFIATERIHKFNGWPEVNKPTFSKERRVNKMPSGRVNIAKTRGSFSCDLKIKVTSDTDDLAIHEDLYERVEGVLMLITGGDESQFTYNGQNYRNEDIVLVLPIDEYQNPYYKKITTNGIMVNMKLAEVDR